MGRTRDLLFWALGWRAAGPAPPIIHEEPIYFETTLHRSIEASTTVPGMSVQCESTLPGREHSTQTTLPGMDVELETTLPERELNFSVNIGVRKQEE